YRQSLTPSLLGFARNNYKAGYESFALFESNKTHSKADGLTHERVPVERSMLAATITRQAVSGAVYYEAKALLEYVTTAVGVTCRFEPLETARDAVVAAPFEPKRSAAIVTNGGSYIGVVGEYDNGVAKAFKLPEAAGFELY